MSMDISQTTAPKSDQQNFDDYIAGPKTVTVSEVPKGSSEQPVEIHLVEFPGRPYKPNKSMRRVLVAAWGSEASAYTGRRMTLFGDPGVKWAGEQVGGIKIGALSHIDKKLTVNLTVTKGKRAPHTVEVLENAPAPQQQPQVTEVHVEASSNEAQLREWWNAHPNLRAVIEARVAVLKGAAETKGGE
mgnify:CR=1 FL=1